jgi:hypothetical protein
MLRWKLTEEDDTRAAILSSETIAKLQTMNVELAESLAEFAFEAGGNSGVLLNTPDFWQLRGRRSLVLQLLNEHMEAMGLSQTNSEPQEAETQTASQQTF